MENKRRTYYRRSLLVLLVVCGFAMAYVYKVYVVETVPDTILLRKGEEERISFEIPVSATMVMSDSSYVKTPVATSMCFVPGEEKSYKMDLKYMGIVPLKTVRLDVVSGKEVAISGMPVGIYVKTKGVLVIDTGSYVNLKGEEVSPSEDVLQPGDHILQVNGADVIGKRPFVNLVESSNGEEMILTLLRNGEVSKIKVQPQQNEEGVFKLGVWIRDSAQGIGTLSYITKEGQFAALGHGVNDADLGEIMALERGSIYETNILAIRKADDAMPGEFTGVITFDESDYMGSIEKNTTEGIYGSLSDEYLLTQRGEEFLGDCVVYPVGLKQEIREGEAQIYCCIEEAPAFYDVYIEEVICNPQESNMGIMLTITDDELLAKTGGIVQGMSGSPIIQDGKIVGAVTHVLVNDPTKGYGIFLENMLNHGN